MTERNCDETSWNAEAGSTELEASRGIISADARHSNLRRARRSTDLTSRVVIIAGLVGPEALVYASTFPDDP
jgi:hypothetical protein